MSEREAHALRQIEQQLSSDDPKLVALMARKLPARPWLVRRFVQNLIIVVAALLATLCIALGDVGAGLAAALFACVVLVLRRSSRWNSVSRRWRAWPSGPA